MQMYECLFDTLSYLIENKLTTYFWFKQHIALDNVSK